MYYFLGTSYGESGVINLKFRDLFELLRNKGPLNPTNVESRLCLYEFINKQCNVKGHNIDNEKDIKNKLLNFTIVLNKSGINIIEIIVNLLKKKTNGLKLFLIVRLK